MTNTREVCKHCGADEGLHHYETMQCPRGGVEAPIGRKQEWMQDTYEVDRSQELAALRTDNATLRATLDEIRQETYMPDGSRLSDEVKRIMKERDDAKEDNATLAARVAEQSSIIERIAISMRSTNDDNHLTQLETLPNNVDELIEMWRVAQDGALSEEIRADKLAALVAELEAQINTGKVAAASAIDYLDSLEYSGHCYQLLLAWYSTPMQSAQPVALTPPPCVEGRECYRKGWNAAREAAADLAVMSDQTRTNLSASIRALTPPDDCGDCNPLKPEAIRAKCECVCGCDLDATTTVDGHPSCSHCAGD